MSACSIASSRALCVWAREESKNGGICDFVARVTTVFAFLVTYMVFMSRHEEKPNGDPPDSEANEVVVEEHPVEDDRIADKDGPVALCDLPDPLPCLGHRFCGLISPVFERVSIETAGRYGLRIEAFGYRLELTVKRLIRCIDGSERRPVERPATAKPKASIENSPGIGPSASMSAEM